MFPPKSYGTTNSHWNPARTNGKNCAMTSPFVKQSQELPCQKSNSTDGFNEAFSTLFGWWEFTLHYTRLSLGKAFEFAVLDLPAFLADDASSGDLNSAYERFPLQFEDLTENLIARAGCRRNIFDDCLTVPSTIRGTEELLLSGHPEEWPTAFTILTILMLVRLNVQIATDFCPGFISAERIIPSLLLKHASIDGESTRLAIFGINGDGFYCQGSLSRYVGSKSSSLMHQPFSSRPLCLGLASLTLGLLASISDKMQKTFLEIPNCKNESES
ncbi:uncharacterized protein BDR25DRAFT_390901 [Lindgomyces ingoldianus]|uniref:Uncharacterized protein n=1 Tax=Lindgomyces ingoldianus TaxID=673940 RepID=A0ACB6RCN4_9PLEO|nr:uncharacterized protein BDR25DRAFT_390901 [Lindgomyces ingoldianus]KAF2476277.1 hypothetical protein BDR25DRAFT_390901 [Lindgomyces ingoldianus]